MGSTWRFGGDELLKNICIFIFIFGSQSLYLCGCLSFPHCRLQFPILQENLDVYLGLQQFIVTTGTGVTLFIPLSFTCRLAAMFALQTYPLRAFSRHFYPKRLTISTFVEGETIYQT